MAHVTVRAPATPVTALRRVIARHPVAVFLTMVFAIDIAVALSPALTRRDLLPFAQAPHDWLTHILGSAVAAFVVTAAVHGRDGVRDLDLFDQPIAAAHAAIADDRPDIEQQLVSIDRQIRETNAALERYLRAFETGTMPDHACAPASNTCPPAENSSPTTAPNWLHASTRWIINDHRVLSWKPSATPSVTSLPPATARSSSSS